MRIALGADHGGVALKDHLARRLSEQGHQVNDLGTHGDESVDYPDYAKQVAESVSGGGADRGILVCGTGQGMAITANKVHQVRAGVVSDPFSARMIVEHNNAQVLCLGARVIGQGLADTIVDAFLGAEFEGGRHARRVSKIES
ncbi:MAG TPA: ribose 5-phosphate isomerase B [Deltaproteobacteria bacterium]|nr:ribose 5-phosphate isomerase B [Deltaproteobacteria bacterium]HCP46575.1 ribose 5-phosphate isomerase B [Deltaproteobacteria bacterium]|tara:strand:- start:383 stop:811 length:429 start_codon:yes stop_codon:yes gene_type:complete